MAEVQNNLPPEDVLKRLGIGDVERGKAIVAAQQERGKPKPVSPTNKETP